MGRKCAKVQRFIFTGTPGSGKTSVTKELEKFGHAVIHEAATDVISLEQAEGIEKPWENPSFIDKVISLQKDRQINASGNLQFYDRSPFCTYALAKYFGQIPSKLLLDEINRCLKSEVYQNQIFFFENLGFIEHTDARKISYEDALIFEQIHLNVYKEFGFDIVMLPKGLTVTQRCEFIKTTVIN